MQQAARQFERAFLYFVDFLRDRQAAVASFADRKLEQAIEKFWKTIQVAMDDFYEFLLESYSEETLRLHGVPKEQEKAWLDMTKSTQSIRQEIEQYRTKLQAHLNVNLLKEVSEIALLDSEHFISIINVMLKKGEME